MFYFWEALIEKYLTFFLFKTNTLLCNLLISFCLSVFIKFEMFQFQVSIEIKTKCLLSDWVGFSVVSNSELSRHLLRLPLLVDLRRGYHRRPILPPPLHGPHPPGRLHRLESPSLGRIFLHLLCHEQVSESTLLNLIKNLIFTYLLWYLVGFCLHFYTVQI